LIIIAIRIVDGMQGIGGMAGRLRLPTGAYGPPDGSHRLGGACFIGGFSAPPALTERRRVW